MDSKETETKLLLTPKKTKRKKGQQTCILARLRYIFAIFSSQISAKMERSDDTLKHGTTNRRCEIYPRDIRFQQEKMTKSGLMRLFLNQEH